MKAFELGLDWQGPGGLSTSVTAYRQRLSDLIYRRRISATLTRTENAGQADVDGIEAQAAVPLGGSGLRLLAALGHQFRYEITRNEAVPASVGKRLTDVPQTTASLAMEQRAARPAAISRCATSATSSAPATTSTAIPSVVCTAPMTR